MSTDIGKDTKESFHDFLQALRRDRERLRVQLNLGTKELRDEWEEVEEKWGVLERRLSEFTEDAKDAAHRAGDEIQEIYQRLREKTGK